MKRLNTAFVVLIVFLVIFVGCGGQSQAEVDKLQQGLNTCQQNLGKEKERADKAEQALAKVPENWTKAEVMQFIKEDRTNQLNLPEGHAAYVYVLQQNATARGLKCFVTLALIKGEPFWYFAGFETIDNEIVHILVPFDQEVNLTEGEDYFEINTFPAGTKIPTGNFTILKVWDYKQ